MKRFGRGFLPPQKFHRRVIQIIFRFHGWGRLAIVPIPGAFAGMSASPSTYSDFPQLFCYLLILVALSTFSKLLENYSHFDQMCSIYSQKALSCAIYTPKITVTLYTLKFRGIPAYLVTWGPLQYTVYKKNLGVGGPKIIPILQWVPPSP